MSSSVVSSSVDMCWHTSKSCHRAWLVLVARQNMRLAATKTPEQQSCLTPHRTRHLFIRQQTSVINSIRPTPAEFGIVAPVGRNGVEQLPSVAKDSNDKRSPEVARACVIVSAPNCRP
jgi:transposase